MPYQLFPVAAIVHQHSFQLAATPGADATRINLIGDSTVLSQIDCCVIRTLEQYLVQIVCPRQLIDNSFEKV